jgi:glutaminyl-peptide cyclotransferase
MNRFPLISRTAGPLLLLSGLLVLSCNDEKPKSSTQPPPEQQQQAYQKVSPDFNADSAYYFVQKQVNFGPRVTNSPEHKKCGDWMVSEFKKYTDNVIEQKATVTSYAGVKLNIRNIIAEINPAALKRILICAHWDSRPYADEDPVQANHNKPLLAADDAASSIGVMLEMARLLKVKRPDIGIDFVCFDAEDWGKSEHGENSYCLGSQYWSANLHKPGYKAEYGILMDMVGSIGARFSWEAYSMRYAEPVVRKVWNTAAQLGYSNIFTPVQVSAVTDDHKYVNQIANIPTIDIINFSDNGFAPHWHTLKDDMSIIDRNTLKAVGQTLLEVIHREKF